MTTKNALQKKASGQKNESQNMLQWVKKMEPQIKKALPSVITAERFSRMVMTAISTNPKLAECTPGSFAGAMLNAAQLGLEPNTPLGQAYLIPYKNHGVMECQFQIGYKGLIDLAHRSGEFKMIYAKEVYEADDFTYSFGLDPKLEHVPYPGADKGAVTHYYAVYTLVNGGFGFEVMSREEVEAFARKYSQAYMAGRMSPWKTNFDEMAKKTVIKKVLKYAPIKTEFVREMSQDETIKTEIDEDMTLAPDITDYEAEVVEETEISTEKETPAEGENEAPAMVVNEETGEVRMDV